MALFGKRKHDSAAPPATAQPVNAQPVNAGR